MLLSRPDVIERLNECFVPVFVNFRDPLPGSREVYNRLGWELIKKYPWALSPSAWILAPDGRVLRCLDVKRMESNPQSIVAELDDVVRQSGVRRQRPTKGYVPYDLSHKKESDVALHVRSRFLLDDDMQSKDARVAASIALAFRTTAGRPKQLFNVRLACPIDEWCVLDAAQARGLLPPVGLIPGQEYDVAPAIARRICRHLCPPTFNRYLEGEVPECGLHGVVVETAAETTVQLSGKYRCKHFFWLGGDEDAEGQVVGYLRFDTGTRRLTRFALATEIGVYGDGKELCVPFAANAELYSGSAEEAGLVR